MPEIVNCPQCERKLRVPDELLGQAVKCPSCGRNFTASAAAVVAPPAAPAPRPTEPEFLQERYELSAPLPPPPPPPGAYPHRAFGSPGDYEFEVQRQRVGQREVALAAVSGPATALLVTAIFGLVIRLLLVVIQLGLVAAVAGGQGARQTPDLMGNAIGGCIGSAIALAIGTVCIIGAIKMRRLESYGWAMTTSILMMIPCSPCCLLGLPFGIWALVVLNKPEVRYAFSA